MDSIDSTFGIGRLIAKHLTNVLTAAEQQQLDAWLKADENNAAMFNRIVVHESLGVALAEMQQINTELALANVKRRIGQKPANRPTKRLWLKIVSVAAAIALVFIGVKFIIYWNNPGRNVVFVAVRPPQDVAPGSNGATLTFSSGEVVKLSDKKNGVVVGEALKYDDGAEVLRGALDDKGNEAITAKTARGQTYSIVLQDGTKVWLNADSKLEFFSNYRNKLQRIVKLIAGEAYLEVAKDAKRPFIMESNGQRVTVLGTHFNISAYKGEGITTTLLEGSVRVAKDGEAVTLKPNEQSVLTNNKITVSEADPNAIAWKNGKFRFRETPLQDVMKQLARWYDVEVVYPDGVPDKKFTGGINRNVNVSEALGLFKFSGLKFTIENKKIIVKK